VRSEINTGRQLAKYVIIPGNGLGYILAQTVLYSYAGFMVLFLSYNRPYCIVTVSKRGGQKVCTLNVLQECQVLLFYNCLYTVQHF
jgi:hypothetical protein